MKNQIGWCFEEMLKIVGGKNLPHSIISNDDLITAKDTISKLFNVAVTLDKLVMDKNLKNILKSLENQSFNDIKFQAEHIDKLFVELHKMILDLEKYLSGLQGVLDLKDNDLWKNHPPHIANMITFDFYHYYSDLREEFQTVLHTKEQLQNLLIYEEHLEHFLE